MYKKHFNNIPLFVLAFVSSASAVLMFAYMIYLNHNNVPAMVFLSVFELILFSMFAFITIWLFFFVKCLSFYRYNEQQIEHHFLNKYISIKYIDIVSVEHNKSISTYKTGTRVVYAHYHFNYVDIKTETTTIVLRVDLYLKEVRALIIEKNKSFKEDEVVTAMVDRGC